MRKDIKIFISCAMRELEGEREVAQHAIEEISARPILFELFPALNNSASSAFLEDVRCCDVFALIVWKSFSYAVSEEYLEAVRSNKPILVFVKTLAENEEREPSLKAFIDMMRGGDGSTFVGGFGRPTVYKDFRRLADLERELKDSVLNELSKYYQEPIFTLSAEEMYNLGRDIAVQSRKRLYVVQNTSSLILGSRPYLADAAGKLGYDERFRKTLSSWLDDHVAEPNCDFMHLFSLSATVNEIRQGGLGSHAAYVDGLKERLEYYTSLEIASHGKYSFRAVRTPFSGPMIVGDNRLAIWIVGGDAAVAIQGEKVCAVLSRVLRTRCIDFVEIQNLAIELGFG